MEAICRTGFCTRRITIDGHPLIHTEDYASVLLRFEDGTRGVFTVSQVSAGRKNRLSFEINGSKSSAFWNQEEPEKLWIGHREKPNEGVLSMPFWKVMPQANGLMWTIQIKRGNAK